MARIYIGPRTRIAIVIAFFAAPWIVAKASGLLDQLEIAQLRALVASWGAWGIVGFLLIFMLSEFVHVPGLMFFAAAILAWGEGSGFAIGFAGAVLRVSASFVVVRAIGGKALLTLQRPWVRRLLARLDRRPVMTVAALRTVFIMNIALNYALAMTNLRLRDYALGSAIGLVPPLVAATILFDWFFR